MTTTTRPPGAPGAPPVVLSTPQLASWIDVRTDGQFDLRVGKVELGQGIHTALAQVAAEGLGVSVDRVRVQPASTTGPDVGITAGSMSVQHVAPALRFITSKLRALFTGAAAERFGCAVDSVKLLDGAFEAPDGRRAPYAELRDLVDLDVSALDLVGTSAPVTQPSAVGTSTPRLDLPDKVAGQPVFVNDLRLPGMQYGRVLRPPSPSARLSGLDLNGLAGLDAQVVRDGSFVGVLAEDEWAADQALARLAAGATWTEVDDLPDEDAVAGFLRAGPHVVTGLLDEPGAAPPGQRLQASYSRPFLAHASLAPSGAAARWEHDGSIRVWSHSQGIFRLRNAIAKALDLSTASVTVQHMQNAGCYGHNGADDAAFDAVLLARTVPGRPVLVRWSRQDELSWAPFGSAMVADVSGTLDADGRIVGWEYDVWSQGHTSRPGYAGTAGLLAGWHVEHAVERSAPADPPVEGGEGTLRDAVPLYDVGPRRVTGHRLTRSPLRTSALRSLGSFLNVFAVESFVDEAARMAGRDSLDFRIDHLTDQRAVAVLERAAAEAGWGEPTPDGVGRGIAVTRYKGRGAYCAVVAEVEAETDVRLRRLVAAVDVGQVINPDGVRNQIEGGLIQAASWTLRERVRFDRRRITSIDWESYPILRFSEIPTIQVSLVDRPDLASVGSGECAQGPTAGAIGNAVADAIGVRVRDLPITTSAVVAAIEAEPD